MKPTNKPRTHEAMENKFVNESNFQVVKQVSRVEKIGLFGWVSAYSAVFRPI